MESRIARALTHGHTIDITTTGRVTGAARRIEIVFHNIDGRIIISGMPRPGTRAWIHNLEADPRITLHLKGPAVHADIDGTARVITDPDERRMLLTGVARNWNRTDVETMVQHSPLIEVTVPGYPS